MEKFINQPQSNQEKAFNEETDVEIETNINSIQQIISDVNASKEKIKPDQIKEIRDLIAKMPSLVINFDDTITSPPENDLTNPDQVDRKIDNCSIRLICCEIIALAEDHPEYNQNRIHAMAFLHRLNNERNKINAKSQQLMAEKELLPFFYQHVLGGINETQLTKIYETIVGKDDIYEAINFNENFISAVKIISQRLEIKKIPVFVLSLNTPELMKIWYEKNLPNINKKLRSEVGVEIELIATMGNQLIWDSNESGERKLRGIIQQVTNSNKKDYIPEGTIMLADNRETQARAIDGVNVVNIEGDRYKAQLLEYSCAVIEIVQILKDLGVNLDDNKPQEYDELTSKLTALKIYTEKIELTAKKKRRSLSKIELTIFNKLELNFEVCERNMRKWISALDVE